MSHRSCVNNAGLDQDVTVSFGDHFQASTQFDTVFREGMELVERTACYLDGDGRRDSKKLKSPVSMVYASESMRLTTRLLDMASWLLIRRALKSGEISEAEARAKRQRVKLKAMGRPSHITHFEDLPEGLQALIRESCALHDRIVKLDRSMSGVDDGAVEQMVSDVLPATNPVGQQLDRLRRAFGH
ncbi:MAG: DUF1465 family protein [Pseudomonadota bacterium]